MMQDNESTVSDPVDDNETNTTTDDTNTTDYDYGSVESVDYDGLLDKLIEGIHMHDSHYSIYSRHQIKINHEINLGDLLIATILALILIHMFLRDFVRR